MVEAKEQFEICGEPLIALTKIKTDAGKQSCKLIFIPIQGKESGGRVLVISEGWFMKGNEVLGKICDVHEVPKQKNPKLNLPQGSVHSIKRAYRSKLDIRKVKVEIGIAFAGPSDIPDHLSGRKYWAILRKLLERKAKQEAKAAKKAEREAAKAGLQPQSVLTTPAPEPIPTPSEPTITITRSELQEAIRQELSAALGPWKAELLEKVVDVMVKEIKGHRHSPTGAVALASVRANLLLEGTGDGN